MSGLGLFFSALIAMQFIGITAYILKQGPAFRVRHMLPHLSLTVLSLISVNIFWPLSFAFLLPLVAPMFMKLRYGDLASFSMLSSVTLSFGLLNLFLLYDVPYLAFLAFGLLVAINTLGILGIFRDTVIKYLFVSNLIQLIFVALDISVAKAAGKLEILGTIQVFNYSIAGLLLFLALGFLSRDSPISRLSGMHGLWEVDRHTSFAAVLAAISLAGLPGLNIFVSEWFLFVASYSISPALTMMGIFAALILFIMYFKLVYTLLTGQGEYHPQTPASFRASLLAMGIACIILGLLPWLQLYILLSVPVA